MFLCVQKEICLYSLLRGIHEIKFLERQVLNVPAYVFSVIREVLQWLTLVTI